MKEEDRRNTGSLVTWSSARPTGSPRGPGRARWGRERFEAIKAYGEESWLGELAERLKKKDYRPEVVKRVWISKPNGKLRPLGIPTITYPVVQTAAMRVLEPIFKADLQPEQYVYRAERSAQDAV